MRSRQSALDKVRVPGGRWSNIRGNSIQSFHARTVCSWVWACKMASSAKVKAWRKRPLRKERVDFETRSIFVRVFVEGRLGLVSGRLTGVGGGGLALRYGCWGGLDEGVGARVLVLRLDLRQCRCLWRCFPWKNCHSGDRWEGLELGLGSVAWQVCCPLCSSSGSIGFGAPGPACGGGSGRSGCGCLHRAAGWPVGKQIAVPNTFGGVSPVLLLECIPMKK